MITSIAAFAFCSCTYKENKTVKVTYTQQQEELITLLNEPGITQESCFTIISRLTSNYRTENDNTGLVFFLTDYVEKHPHDQFNAYWLLMVALSYIEQGGIPIAEYYFDRILNNYEDLLIKNTSVHFTCLQNLIQISTSPDSRIAFFTQLVSRFPDKISLTETYIRLASEYEKLGEWEQMLKCYSMFKAQPDATTIQISGIPNAYLRARQMIDFNESTKDWSFESLESLESAIKDALNNQNYKLLDRYKSKVNFFAMSWRQNENDANSQANFSMSTVMSGRIHFSDTFDESSNPSEAFLRTWGWEQYVSVWYFYFRKINFPLDPDVHGRWEWAGIYYGEKL